MDATGQPIVNSCGDPVYCLPVRKDADYTKYRVTVKAAELRQCDPATQACAGLGYDGGPLTDSCRQIPLAGEAGAPTPVCGNTDGVYYMKANDPAHGLIDLANNSLDGNKNGHSAGPYGQSKTAAYDLIDKVPATGDDLGWTFYINNKVDLSAPVVISVTPTVNGNGQSLISPLNAGFNKLLMSSTVKPGTGYPDGKCSCAATSDCKDADQICVTGQCVNKTHEQAFCAQNDECKSGQTCAAKKYVTLYDLTTQPVGWWVGNFGQDVRMCISGTNLYRQCTSNSDCAGGACGQTDGYSDRSVVLVNHTAFFESTKYSGEMASGVKDIYQNCFIPGKGPISNTCDTFANPSGCCGVSISGATPQPYCCNGAAQATACTP